MGTSFCMTIRKVVSSGSADDCSLRRWALSPDVAYCATCNPIRVALVRSPRGLFLYTIIDTPSDSVAPSEALMATDGVGAPLKNSKLDRGAWKLCPLSPALSTTDVSSRMLLFSMESGASPMARLLWHPSLNATIALETLLSSSAGNDAPFSSTLDRALETSASPPPAQDSAGYRITVCTRAAVQLYNAASLICPMSLRMLLMEAACALITLADTSTSASEVYRL
mmetsp:Transcript_15974/g.34815  ORF Transcript_15974/g.34815 Transcript_15974/m.34815 type:complete len:225 (-) Transcript_15974:1291-1965(-)